jgi:hypothetical protein
MAIYPSGSRSTNSARAKRAKRAAEGSVGRRESWYILESVSEFLRFYEDTGEKRVYRRQRIGTVREFPHRRDAEKAVLALRGKINTEVSSPETVNDLLTHYQKYELTPARKAYASIQNHLTLAKCYIAPRWGSYKLGAVRTVQVEEWLDSPISSRKSVPPSADSNLPIRLCSAPVKAPFSCPKSSEAISDWGMAAQFTRTKALAARFDLR